MVRDECVPARVAGAGRYSEAFLATIDAGLAVRPEDRPQDMAALAQRLGLVPQRGQPVRAAAAPVTAAASATKPATGVPLPTHGGVTGGVTGGVGTAMPAPKEGHAGRWVLGAAAAGLLLLIAGWGLLGRRSGDRAPGDMAAVTTPARAPASAPAPVVSSAPLAPPTATLSSPAAPPTPLPRGPFSPVAALEEVLRGADAAIQLEARADLERLVIDRDRLQFRLSGNVAGHVYVLFVGTDGRALQMLFPNAIDADNRLAAGQELVLPRPKWRITAGGPPGTDHVLVLLSPQPRRFEAAGARRDAREALTGFDPVISERAWAASATGPGLFAGVAECPSGPTPCDRRYGAALVRIREIAATP